MLELVDIVHNYDGKRLLDGVNFTVGENEVLCLLGPSGGGKSTILRIIAGFDKPVSGKVLYKGRDITNDPIYTRDFGMVFSTRPKSRVLDQDGSADGKSACVNTDHYIRMRWRF